MRENDEDDAPESGPQGSLADGVGETAERDGHESSGEPYGDVDFDDPDDTVDTDADDTTVDDTYDSDETYGSDDTYDSDETYDSDDTYGTEGTYGDGDDTGSDGDLDDPGGDEPTDDTDTTTTADVGDEAFVAQDGSPIEGIAFLLDEVRDALFGEDDAAAASPFDTDPAGLETDTDLDLTGDGVVDRADLHEAGSMLDFDVAGQGGHGDHHDDGLMDA